MDVKKQLPSVQMATLMTPKAMQNYDCRRDFLQDFQRRPSELSLPSLMTDSFSSSSDGCFEEDHSDFASLDGWDSYWTTGKDTRPPSCYLDVAVRPQLQTQLSYENRNFASLNLPKLNAPKSLHNLRQTAANHSLTEIHIPQTRDRSQTLVPFPPPPPVPNHHSPWSCMNRSRANTSPCPYEHNERPPSSLSVCSTLTSHNPSVEGSPLFMKLPPSTPPFAPSLGALPPLDLMQETSYFEFDDDDDDDNSPRARIAKVFRRRGSSNTSDTPDKELKDPKESFSDRPKRKFRKRVSDANQTLKGVFGIKK